METSAVVPRPPPSASVPVFLDTNLDTYLAMLVSPDDTVASLKEKIGIEHNRCFPTFGKVSVVSLKVKLKEFFYEISDSMPIKRAFDGRKGNWFLNLDLVPPNSPLLENQSVNKRAVTDKGGEQPQKHKYVPLPLSSVPNAYESEALPDALFQKPSESIQVTEPATKIDALVESSQKSKHVADQVTNDRIREGHGDVAVGTDADASVAIKKAKSRKRSNPSQKPIQVTEPATMVDALVKSSQKSKHVADQVTSYGIREGHGDVAVGPDVDASVAIKKVKSRKRSNPSQNKELPVNVASNESIQVTEPATKVDALVESSQKSKHVADQVASDGMQEGHGDVAVRPVADASVSIKKTKSRKRSSPSQNKEFPDGKTEHPSAKKRKHKMEKDPSFKEPGVDQLRRQSTENEVYGKVSLPLERDLPDINFKEKHETNLASPKAVSSVVLKLDSLLQRNPVDKKKKKKKKKEKRSRTSKAFGAPQEQFDNSLSKTYASLEVPAAERNLAEKMTMVSSEGYLSKPADNSLLQQTSGYEQKRAKNKKHLRKSDEDPKEHPPEHLLSRTDALPAKQAAEKNQIEETKLVTSEGHHKLSHSDSAVQKSTGDKQKRKQKKHFLRSDKTAMNELAVDSASKTDASIEKISAEDIHAEGMTLLSSDGFTGITSHVDSLQKYPVNDKKTRKRKRHLSKRDVAHENKVLDTSSNKPGSCLDKQAAKENEVPGNIVLDNSLDKPGGCLDKPAAKEDEALENIVLDTLLSKPGACLDKPAAKENEAPENIVLDTSLNEPGACLDKPAAKENDMEGLVNNGELGKDSAVIDAVELGIQKALDGSSAGAMVDPPSTDVRQSNQTVMKLPGSGTTSINFPIQEVCIENLEVAKENDMEGLVNNTELGKDSALTDAVEVGIHKALDGSSTEGMVDPPSTDVRQSNHTVKEFSGSETTSTDFPTQEVCIENLEVALPTNDPHLGNESNVIHISEDITNTFSDQLMELNDILAQHHDGPGKESDDAAVGEAAGIETPATFDSKVSPDPIGKKSKGSGKTPGKSELPGKRASMDDPVQLLVDEVSKKNEDDALNINTASIGENFKSQTFSKSAAGTESTVNSSSPHKRTLHHDKKVERSALSDCPPSNFDLNQPLTGEHMPGNMEKISGAMGKSSSGDLNVGKCSDGTSQNVVDGKSSKAISTELNSFSDQHEPEQLSAEIVTKGNIIALEKAFDGMDMHTVKENIHGKSSELTESNDHGEIPKNDGAESSGNTEQYIPVSKKRPRIAVRKVPISRIGDVPGNYIMGKTTIAVPPTDLPTQGCSGDELIQ